jgi:hypothetical protein
MTDLPVKQMYALRHGATSRVWEVCPGLWLYKSPASLKKAWETAQDAGLVRSCFHEHKIITIKLSEVKKNA